jgi:hypothetical protein
LLRCRSGATTICLGSTLTTHSQEIRRPCFLAVKRSIKLPAPHIKATTRPFSQ